MVTIKYFESATDKQCEISESVSVAEFLKSKDFTVQELQSLRFFKGNVLGAEIDTSDVSFLDIDEGDIEVINGNSIPHGPALPYLPYIIAAISFVVAITLKPSIADLPPSQKQKSSTNALGQSSNEANIGSRVPDVYGRVTKHTPPLAQVPYRIGIDNQEVEVLLLTVGVGKYDIDLDEIYDGYTPYVDIDNALVDIYEPGKYPGKSLPDQKIGDGVDQQIGIYSQSNDLNPAELLPRNEITTTEINWQLSGEPTGTIATLVARDIPSGFDFEGNYAVGTELVLSDIYYHTDQGTTTLYFTNDDITSIEYEFDSYDTAVDLGDHGTLNYVVTAVTSDTITLSIPVTASQFVKDAWIAMSNYSPWRSGYHFVDFPGSTSGVDFYTQDNNATLRTYYADSARTQPLVLLELTYLQLVDTYRSEYMGPFTVKKETTEIVVNLVSESGFYKLDNNNETSISADVEFLIEELDSNGTATGSNILHAIKYSSNVSVRKSVFQTHRFNIPYTNARVSGRRVSLRDKSDGISNVDTIKWRDLYAFEPHSETMDLGNVTMMHCLVPSNSQSQLIKDRKTNLDLTRKVTQYLGNGSFGSSETYATDNFAQILIHTALNSKNGRLNINQINADGFLAVSDAIISYFGNNDMTRFGYVFDDNEMSYEEMFTIICDAANCIPYSQNGVYDIFFERDQPTSSVQITCRNKIPETEVREDIFFKEYDGVELTYRSETSSVQETIYVPEDRTANNPNRVELLGVFNEQQARVKANRIRNKQIYHTTNVEFDTDEFGRLIVPGQRIDSPDGTRFVKRTGETDGYVIYEGEVVEFNGLTVELSEPVTFASGEDHYIQFTNAEGENSELILCTVGTDEFQVILSTTPSESLYDGYQRDKTKFTFCSEQVRESIALIPQTIETKVDNGSETSTISSINYDSRYYQQDLL